MRPEQGQWPYKHEIALLCAKKHLDVIDITLFTKTMESELTGKIKMFYAKEKLSRQVQNDHV